MLKGLYRDDERHDLSGRSCPCACIFLTLQHLSHNLITKSKTYRVFDYFFTFGQRSPRNVTASGDLKNGRRIDIFDALEIFTSQRLGIVILAINLPLLSVSHVANISRW